MDEKGHEPEELWSLLPTEVLLRIYALLSARDLAVCMAVARAWRVMAGADTLWRDALKRDWGQADVRLPFAPDAPCASCREAYAAMVAEYGEVSPELVRFRKAWGAIEGWAEQHLPPLRASLARGVRPAALAAAAAELRLPPPAKWAPCALLWWRLHDGQRLAFDVARDAGSGAELDDPSVYHGLPGGVAFYDTIMCGRLLPLATAVRYTRLCRQRRVLQAGLEDTPLLLLSATQDISRRIFLNVVSGELVAYRGNGGGPVMAHPYTPPLGAVDCTGCGEGVLRWLEQLALQLVGGALRVGPVLGSDVRFAALRGVSLFAAAGAPTASVAVTRGVRVEAAALYIPELSSDMRGEFFAYSVRFELLSREAQRAAWADADGPFRPMERVQLRARRWVITDTAGRAETIEGAGVVGAYPLLHAGGEPFVYQSCTHLPGVPGRMGGGFEFVEGSLEQPLGPAFEAACAPFPLALPPYIF